MERPPEDTMSRPGQDPETEDLLHDWNTDGPQAPSRRPVELYDESLRDGIQSPSVTDPDVEDKKQLLRLMDRLGIQWADIGLPGAGPRAAADVAALAETIRDEKLAIKGSCAARTLVADVEPVVRISQEVGIPLEVMAFIGSSPIRQFVEDWDLPMMRRCVEESIEHAVKAGIPACLVTEDTTRARPGTLDDLYRRAIDKGAYRICLCDTVGHATPDGARRLVEWALELVERSGAPVLVDWHGHNDRGLSIPRGVERPGAVELARAAAAAAQRAHEVAAVPVHHVQHRVGRRVEHHEVVAHELEPGRNGECRRSMEHHGLERRPPTRERALVRRPGTRRRVPAAKRQGRYGESENRPTCRGPAETPHPPGRGGLQGCPLADR